MTSEDITTSPHAWKKLMCGRPSGTTNQPQVLQNMNAMTAPITHPINNPITVPIAEVSASITFTPFKNRTLRVTMQPKQLAQSKRCLARTRSGTECQSPAVKGRKRCRMHGGTNPGAPKGNSNARKHGARSARAMAAARYLREIARLVR